MKKNLKNKKSLSIANQCSYSPSGLHDFVANKKHIGVSNRIKYNDKHNEYMCGMQCLVFIVS